MKIVVMVGPPRVRDYVPSDRFPVQRFEFTSAEREVAEDFAGRAEMEGYDVKLLLM